MSKLNNKMNKKHKRLEIKDNLSPINIEMSLNITKDSFTFGPENTFTIFKSINDILYLIYSNKNNSIISYNLNNNKILNEIKKAHINYITSFRNCFDNINKRDLIMSISFYDNNIKLWNINNYECLLNIKNINKNGWLFSACFLNDKNKIYIITSKFYFNEVIDNSIKIFDIKGNKINEINDSNESIYFTDTYYDNKYSKNYIISGNIGQVKSYDYEKN